MAETQGTSGFGTLIAYLNSASPPVYVKVPEIFEVGGPNQSAEEIEMTHMESPGNRREFIQSFIDGGELAFSINFLPENAIHQNLLDDQTARTERTWKVQWPDAGDTTWSFTGFVKSFEPSAPIDGRLSAAVVIRVTGDIDFDDTAIE